LSALLLWSLIHLLSIFTLVTLPLGVWMAHRHGSLIIAAS
jgi:uncharacterized membrane protein